MAFEIPKKVATEMFNLKKSKKIVYGMVKHVTTPTDEKPPEIIVDYKNVACHIPKSNVDNEVPYKTLGHFVGKVVPFVVLSFNWEEGIAVCSRAEALDILRPITTAELEKGTVMNGTILRIMPYGAYVDINGVTGLLKNADFSDDAIVIGDVKAAGEPISVKFKNYTDHGKMLFETVPKYKSPHAIRPEDISVDQFVLGVVRARKPFGYFVNVAPGLDVLAFSEAKEDIDVNQHVSVKILKVYHDQEGRLRLRGVIKKVISEQMEGIGQ